MKNTLRQNQGSEPNLGAYTFMYYADSIQTKTKLQKQLLDRYARWASVRPADFGKFTRSYYQIAFSTQILSRDAIREANLYLRDELGVLTWKRYGNQYTDIAKTYTLNLDILKVLGKEDATRYDDFTRTLKASWSRNTQMVLPPHLPYQSEEAGLVRGSETFGTAAKPAPLEDIKEDSTDSNTTESPVVPALADGEEIVTRDGDSGDSNSCSLRCPEAQCPQNHNAGTGEERERRESHAPLNNTDIYVDWVKDDVDGFIDFYGAVLTVKEYRRNREGIHNWKLTRCPWCDGNDCKISLGYYGSVEKVGLAFSCFSPECESDAMTHKFQMLRSKLEEETGRRYSMRRGCEVEEPSELTEMILNGKVIARKEEQ